MSTTPRIKIVNAGLPAHSCENPGLTVGNSKHCQKLYYCPGCGVLQSVGTNHTHRVPQAASCCGCGAQKPGVMDFLEFDEKVGFKAYNWGKNGVRSVGWARITSEYYYRAYFTGRLNGGTNDPELMVDYDEAGSEAEAIELVTSKYCSVSNIKIELMSPLFAGLMGGWEQTKAKAKRMEA